MLPVLLKLKLATAAAAGLAAAASPVPNAAIATVAITTVKRRIIDLLPVRRSSMPQDCVFPALWPVSGSSGLCSR